ELNVASCAMNSVFDCGLVGSWFCNCTTSSFRKASLPIESARLVPACGVAVVALVPWVASILTVCSLVSLPPRVLQGGELIDVFHFALAFGIEVPPPCPIAQSLHHFHVAHRDLEHARCLVGHRTEFVVLPAAHGRVFPQFVNPI